MIKRDDSTGRRILHPRDHVSRGGLADMIDYQCKMQQCTIRSQRQSPETQECSRLQVVKASIPLAIYVTTKSGYMRRLIHD